MFSADVESVHAGQAYFWTVEAIFMVKQRELTADSIKINEREESKEFLSPFEATALFLSSIVTSRGSISLSVQVKNFPRSPSKNAQ